MENEQTKDPVLNELTANLEAEQIPDPVSEIAAPADKKPDPVSASVAPGKDETNPNSGIPDDEDEPEDDEDGEDEPAPAPAPLPRKPKKQISETKRKQTVSDSNRAKQEVRTVTDWFLRR